MAITEVKEPTPEQIAAEKKAAAERETKVKQMFALATELSVTIPDNDRIISNEVYTLVGKAYQMQNEYNNESKFAVEFIRDAMIAYAKYSANAAINDWERAIAKAQKLHKEFNREQAIEFLRATRSGRECEEFATVAEVVKQELS